MDGRALASETAEELGIGRIDQGGRLDQGRNEPE